ncbi:MAG: toll/interleukin-1 receptor domain-containing protein, partial [Fimbriimonas ginsengisoli]|nr:toll/interleukin-1 receptor domain-containing protein [Fimbriimonas ginsengisoli]
MIALKVARVPKVFISYAWENQAHQDRVLALADWLEQSGVEVIFDQYEPNPSMGWANWMACAIEKSDFVLSVCTQAYRQRVMEDQPAGIGLGVQWEGSLISNALSSGGEGRKKFLVVQFDAEELHAIPTALAGRARFVISEFDLNGAQCQRLYRLITDQPEVVRPTRGELILLPSRARTVVPRSGLHRVQGLGKMNLRAPEPRERKSGERSLPKTPGGRGTAAHRMAIALMRKARASYFDDDDEPA